MEKCSSMNIAFIPLRSGSKSILNKNIKQFCEKPLVYWSLQALQNANKIDKIVVAIDSEEYKRTVESLNLSKVVCYWRDTENSQDNSSTESVMLEYISKSQLNSEDLFVLVQATSPFTRSIDIDLAVEQLHRENANSLLSCVLSKRFFWSKQCRPVNYDFNKRPRRQDFEGMYMENGAFYINKVINIINSKNRLTEPIAIYEMPECSAIDIDEETDWIIAESLMKNLLREGDSFA